MRPTFCLWALVTAAPLAAAPPGRVRWDVSPPPPGDQLDTRPGVPLVELKGQWIQLVGEDASSATPELYPRRPEPRIVSDAQTREAALELEARGARALVAALPRPLPAFPRYRLRARVDTSRLGAGEGRLELHLVRARAAAGWASLAIHELASWPPGEPAEVAAEGEIPEAATHAAVVVRLAGGQADAPSFLRLLTVELEGLPGLRCRWPRGPLTARGVPLRLAVALEGGSRGRSTLSYTVGPLAGGAPAAAIPTAPVAAWAPAGQAARWQVVLDTASLESGGHAVELVAVDAAGERHVRALAFAVLPPGASPQLRSAIGLLEEAEARLGPPRLLHLQLPGGPTGPAVGWALELTGDGPPPARLGISWGIPPVEWARNRDWTEWKRRPGVGLGDADWSLWGPKTPPEVNLTIYFK